jgi:transcription antitermination factor NusB
MERFELAMLVGKAVALLCDYAKQALADANGLLLKAGECISDIEVEHPVNAAEIDDLKPVPLTTGQLKEQLALLERALHFVSEALDIPEMTLQAGQITRTSVCKKCNGTSEQVLESPWAGEAKEFLIRLIETYAGHRDQIDEFIKQAKAKWKIDRMVSIDRDILRLACTEAFFMPDVPVNVCVSEAVELTHRFADERAARFINGILSDLAAMAVDFRKTGVMKSLETETDDKHLSEIKQ